MICSLCDARCCKERVVTATIFDVLRIIEKTNKNWEEFSELGKVDILNVNYEYLIKCVERGVEMDFLLKIKSHPCVFLRENRCSIYEFAPMVCKIYPFDVEGKESGSACPLGAKILFKIRGVDKKIIKKFKEEDKMFKEIINEWNKRRGNREECMEFMLKRAKEMKMS